MIGKVDSLSMRPEFSGGPTLGQGVEMDTMQIPLVLLAGNPYKSGYSPKGR